MRAIVLASTALVLSLPAYAQTVSVPPSISVVEGSPWSVPVTRIGPKNTTLSFTYCTVPDTALPGTDYVARCGSQSIRKNAMTYTINGLSIDNSVFGNDKRFFLDVTAKGQAPLRTAIVLRDNDPEPPPVVTEPQWEASPSLAGAVPIAAVDPALGIIDIPLPKTAAPDVVGAFRFVCDAGQILADDPLVYPGQPGKSHLHQFYGNTGADAHSTYESLRKTGESTCSVSPLNRSAYWMPAMMDGRGNVVRPDHVQIYYKRRPKSDPKCQGFENRGEGTCVDLPNGLAFIFGFDMVTDKAPTGSIYYQCVATGVTQLHEPSLEGATIQACPVGGRVMATIKAPGCWTGSHLKAPNLRDHVAYAVRDPNYGFMACPKTHPYVIPGFTLTASYQIQAGDDPKLWTLSSDHMRPTLPRGSTFHADFFMAWEPAIAVAWQENCIDKLLNCSAGDLGNGKQLRNVLKADAHLVPLNPS